MTELKPLESPLSPEEVLELGNPSLVRGLIEKAAMRQQATAEGSILDPHFHGHNAQKCIKVEKLWHKAAVALEIAGWSPNDIAASCGVTPSAVAYLRRSPIFQKQVLDGMMKNGGTQAMALLKEQIVPSIKTMVAIRDDKEAPKAVRANICRDFLDRVEGKAVQRVEVKDTTVKSDDPVADVARLQQEVEHLRAAAQGGTN